MERNGREDRPIVDGGRTVKGQLCLLAAHLDRSDTPAISGMYAPLHHVAAAIAIGGIVVGRVVVGIIVIMVAVVGVRVVLSDCKCTERESAPVVEAAAAETIGREGSAAKSTCPCRKPHLVGS